jgi:hypothetical protein
MGANGIIWDSPGLMGNSGRMVVLYSQSSPSPLHQTDTGQTQDRQKQSASCADGMKQIGGSVLLRFPSVCAAITTQGKC